MKECMKIRKGLSALTAALVVTGMLGIGAVEEIKEQIVVEANTQAYSYACRPEGDHDGGVYEHRV